MEALRSAEALQVHWEAAHSSNGGGGASATPISSQYVIDCTTHIRTYTIQLTLYIQPYNVPIHRVHTIYVHTYRSALPSEPIKYVPLPLEPDEDELEHYKTQVKIMTDLINVSEGDREGGRGVGM